MLLVEGFQQGHSHFREYNSRLTRKLPQLGSFRLNDALNVGLGFISSDEMRSPEGNEIKKET